MFKQRLGLFLVLLLALTACLPQPTQAPSKPSMANPASVFCEQNGGKVVMKADASGGTAGTCSFPDGSVCDEWAFFRGECRPGQKATPANPPAPTSSTEWKSYQNERFGYSFRYPADAQVMIDDDPLKSISVVGPLRGNERWPQFTLSHPSDREEYRPPEAADLAQWLVDHHLLGGKRLADVKIAGLAAIHTRSDRTPQSYALDRYYFARAGQLYQLIIGHTGDQEDWALYQRFIDSIQFR